MENNIETKHRLNIGCGYTKRPAEEGWINIDRAPQVKPDLVVDIEQGLPFPDNYFDEIYSEQCLEHIRPLYWRHVLAEIARVAKHGCILELWLPFDNISQRTNVDHYRTFTFSSWDQFTDEDNLRDYYSPLRLHRIEPKPNKLHRIICALLPLPFIRDHIHFKFSVIKEKDNDKNNNQ